MTDIEQLAEGPDDDDAELAELVAYLDGELDPDRIREVEQRLVDDPGLRTRLQELDRTWELLDWLPQSQASDRFTETTVELAAVAAEDSLESNMTKSRAHQKSGWLLAAFGTLVICFGSFAFVWNWKQRDERQLLEDLPLIENLDVYRVADNVEFLRELEKRGLFTETDVEVADE